MIASIDELRARVELQTQQQRLISAQNQLAIDKLTLGRVIGLPSGQEFQLTDSIPYSPLTGITLDEALQRAYVSRADYFGAKDIGSIYGLVLTAWGAAAIAGPTFIAQVRQATGQYQGALKVMALVTLVSAIVPLLLHPSRLQWSRPSSRWRPVR